MADERPRPGKEARLYEEICEACGEEFEPHVTYIRSLPAPRP